MIRCFSWDVISTNLENHAPTLFRVLKGCIAVKSKSRSLNLQAIEVYQFLNLSVCECSNLVEAQKFKNESYSVRGFPSA